MNSLLFYNSVTFYTFSYSEKSLLNYINAFFEYYMDSSWLVNYKKNSTFQVTTSWRLNLDM